MSEEVTLKIRIPKDHNRLIIDLYCLFILLMPVNLISNTAFYEISTPASIWYKYRTFEYSIFVIPLIILAVVSHKKSTAIQFIHIIVAVAIKDFVFTMIGKQNPEVPFDFALYLVLLIAWALSVAIMRYDDGSNQQAGHFLDTYFILAIMTMLLRVVLGMTRFGRYGAIGLSLGGTGFFAAIYVIYLLYVREYSKRVPYLIIIALMALILTGQRTNLFFCVLFCIPYVSKSIFSRGEDSEGKIKSMLLGGILLFTIIAVCILIILNDFGIKIEGFDYITRIFEAVSRAFSGELGGEASLSGRTRSLNVGMAVLSENPFGITNVFYDLQYRMARLTYPTFPHSSVLASALLWSTPITLVCLIWLIRLLVKLRKMRDGYFWIVLYIVILMTIWSGPFVDYPMLFIILLLLSMSHNRAFILNNEA